MPDSGDSGLPRFERGLGDSYEESPHRAASNDRYRPPSMGTKELDCLYFVTRLGMRADTSLSDILEQAVEIIPRGFLFPEAARSRIVFKGREFRSRGFRPGIRVQAADITVGGEAAGVVEVHYLEDKPEADEGPFLAEERKLIDMLAGWVGLLAERKDMEEEWRWESEQNEALAQLSQALLTSRDIEEISWKVLERAKSLTGSRYGYVGYLDAETGYLVSPTLTRDVWDVCRVKGKDIVFKDFKGLWGWVLRNRRPLLTNTPAEDPRSTGVPEGHVPIERFLSVPALVGDMLVGQVALANSVRDYGQKDLELVTRLADLYAVAVIRMWSDQELERYRQHLEDLVRQRTRELEWVNALLTREVGERRERERELRETTERLRALSAHLQTVREEEQKRIAREVHDTLGQALTGLKIELSLLGRKLVDDVELALRVKEITSLVDSTIRTVRDISGRLRPSLLDDLGLEAALEWQLKRLGEKTGMATKLEVQVDGEIPGGDISEGLFRIAQEALTNVARHSGAGKVTVRLFREGGDLVMTVEDDGHGAAPEDLQRADALGVLGMRERAYSLGGNLEIVGSKGKGTTLKVRVPAGRPQANGGREAERKI